MTVIASVFTGTQRHGDEANALMPVVMFCSLGLIVSLMVLCCGVELGLEPF